jgi:hypothetical protein
MPDEPKNLNRFARMMEVAREHQASDVDPPETPPQEQEPAPPAKPRAASKGGRGRPAIGKRSDPDYETTTVFLRRETKTAAGRLLMGDKHQDLSNVLEKLLAAWVRKNSKA